MTSFHSFLVLFLSLFFCGDYFAAAAAATPPRATIFILMDDLGYNEMGFQNSSRGLLTPHLDSLAAGGVRLSSYYTTPLCSPTRGALLTSRYSHRLGLQSNVIYWDTPWGLPLAEKTLPQVFKNITGNRGRTAMFGKVRHVTIYVKRIAPLSSIIAISLLSLSLSLPLVSNSQHPLPPSLPPSSGIWE